MKQDPIHHWLEQERLRQQQGINLIASENYVSPEIMKMVGSVLMNKYIEGNVGARYYSGCQFVDAIEAETINRFKSLFGAQHANVQPHSGSQANFAVYNALLQQGDTVLSMKLSDGGHLTHGHPVSLSGKLYNIISYGVDAKTGRIDYQQVQNLAQQHKPKLIIAGASSYPFWIDFKAMASIASSVGAYFMADVAHTAGLIAAGIHPSPVDYADVVTLTTHKTFRGPRGGVILCTAKLGLKIDRAVMPGIQGGAFAHEIAAKGIACAQAASLEFVEYQKNVVKNAAAMAQEFIRYGYTVIGGGTQTHMLLIDVRPLGFSGKEIESMLELADIFVNRNAIPFDTLPPLSSGGIRIGTAAITTRGATEYDCIAIVALIHEIIKQYRENKDISQCKSMVHAITGRWN